MRAGKMDRLITIERLTESRDSQGSVLKTWSKWRDVWAEVFPVQGNEALSFTQFKASEMIQVTSRYVDGLDPADRISYGGKYWNIKYIRELGRERGTQVIAEVFT